MGLGISVGILDYLALHDAEGLDYHRRGFTRLSQALTAEGISWHEPEVTDPPAALAFSGGFPYSYLARLRRILILAILGEPVTPVSEYGAAQYDHDEGKVMDETLVLVSHLLCHSDAGGYYVPVDFGDPLFLPEEAEVRGAGMVGSSPRLLAELAGIASPLGISPGGEGVASAAQEDGPAVGPASDDPFEPERFAWHQLYQACLASITSGHAIVFH